MLPNYLANIKSSGIYRFVFDKSEMPGQEAETLRLVIGYSEKGPFNTPVYVKTEDEFKKIYGGTSKKMERYGMWFHRMAIQALKAGPILAFNLKNFEGEYDEGVNEVEYTTFTPNQSIFHFEDDEIAENLQMAIKDLYNTDRFWTLEPERLEEYVNDKDEEDHVNNPKGYITIATTDSKDTSVTVFMRGYEPKGYDVPFMEWYSAVLNGEELPSYLEGHERDLVSQYWAEMFIFKGEFTPEIASSDKLAKFFNVDGNKVTLKPYIVNAFGEKIDTLDALAANDASNFVKKYTGILLPDFRNASNTVISLDAQVNGDNYVHKLMMRFNQDMLYSIEPGGDFQLSDLDTTGWSKGPVREESDKNMMSIVGVEPIVFTATFTNGEWQYDEGEHAGEAADFYKYVGLTPTISDFTMSFIDSDNRFAKTGIREGDSIFAGILAHVVKITTNEYTPAVPEQWTVGSDTTTYPTEPVVEHHPSVPEHYTLELVTEYSEEPTVEYVPATDTGPGYWTVNGTGMYYEEPTVEYVPVTEEPDDDPENPDNQPRRGMAKTSGNNGHWVVRGNGAYDSNITIEHVEAVPEQYVIDGEEPELGIFTDMTSPESVPQTDGWHDAWTVQHLEYEPTVEHFNATANTPEYWEVYGTFKYIGEKVVRVENERDHRDILYIVNNKDVYMKEPTIDVNAQTVTGIRRFHNEPDIWHDIKGWHIKMHHKCAEKPGIDSDGIDCIRIYNDTPVVQSYVDNEGPVTYNICNSEEVFKEVFVINDKSISGVLCLLGASYEFNPVIPAHWAMDFEFKCDHEPKINYVEGDNVSPEYWILDIGGGKLITCYSEPSVEEHVAAGTKGLTRAGGYYIVTGTGAFEGDTAPEVEFIEAEDEYWTINGQGSYSEDPGEAVHHDATDAYWTINGQGSYSEDPGDVVHHDAIDAVNKYEVQLDKSDEDGVSVANGIYKCVGSVTYTSKNVNPLYLKGYVYGNSKPTTTRMYDKWQWQKYMLNALAQYKGLRIALTSRVDLEYRYLVDTFEGFVEPECKSMLSTLCKEKDNAFAILNFPAIKTFSKSHQQGGPSFRNEKGEFDTKYIAMGGNPLKPMPMMFTLPSQENGASWCGFFTALKIRDINTGIKEDVPSAALVSNNFMKKYTTYLPYTVIAGTNRGIVREQGLLGPDFNFSREDLDNLEPFGVNCMVYVDRKGTCINSNQTAKQNPVTTLSKISTRELVIFLQDEIEKLLLDYHWDFNTPNLQQRIKDRADVILETAKNNGGVYVYNNQCDEYNNTDDVINNEMFVLSTSIEPGMGAGKMVQELYIYRKGGMSSALVSDTGA